MVGKRRRKNAAIKVNVGDQVLLGNYAAMPGDWFMALVVWAEGDELLVRRSEVTGQFYHQVTHIDWVRASGEVEYLRQTQRACRDAMRDLARKVYDADSALGAARAAMWAALDEMKAGIHLPEPVERCKSIEV